jgi:hypothetical protein
VIQLPSGNDEHFAIEHGPFIVDLPNLKMVIFHIYVSLPEGITYWMLLATLLSKSSGVLASH